MSMRTNLHLHSRFSDGTDWPERVAARAADAGLECAALTDHDSMEGVDGFLEACRGLGILGIAAVEIDCVAPGPTSSRSHKPSPRPSPSPEGRNSAASRS
jgi:hypothetical protein